MTLFILCAALAIAAGCGGDSSSGSKELESGSKESAAGAPAAGGKAAAGKDGGGSGKQEQKEKEKRQEGGSSSGSGEPADGAASGGDDPVLTNKPKPELEAPRGTPPKKLVVVDLEEGSGPVAERGDEVGVLYVGVVHETGKEFDSTWERGGLFNLVLGDGSTIPGFERGIEGMRVGGRRKLIVPPRLAYGPNAIAPDIPSRSTLVFVVDLLEVG
jgi:peptidylprolyl isomerase